MIASVFRSTPVMEGTAEILLQDPTNPISLRYGLRIGLLSKHIPSPDDGFDGGNIVNYKGN